jgi:ribosome-associated protein
LMASTKNRPWPPLPPLSIIASMKRSNPMPPAPADAPELDEDDGRPSKSALKREMHALQDLGAALVNLSDGELAVIPLQGLLAEAIQTARKIKSHEGLRRQMQYIGKLMRKEDTSAIAASFTDLQQGRQQRNQQFHQLEQLRDSVIERGLEAMDSVLERYPSADRQHLRQLIVAATKEKEQTKPPAAARKLFRYLRELAEL